MESAAGWVGAAGWFEAVYCKCTSSCAHQVICFSACHTASSGTHYGHAEEASMRCVDHSGHPLYATMLVAK